MRVPTRIYSRILLKDNLEETHPTDIQARTDQKQKLATSSAIKPKLFIKVPKPARKIDHVSNY